MPHYVLSHRRAGKRHDHEHHAARSAMADAMDRHVDRIGGDVRTHRPHHDTARHVARFEADAADVAAVDWHPELICEPLIRHFIRARHASDTGRALPHEIAIPLRTGSADCLVVRVVDELGLPVSDVDVFAYFGSATERVQAATRTDTDGSARLDHDPERPLLELAVAPPSRWWPQVIDHSAGPEITVRLALLPAAEGGLGWWHREAGLEAVDPERGRGIAVGVVDSGLGHHPALAHANNLGAFLDGAHRADGGDDRGHGTHVAGAIGARPTCAEEYAGLAPGARIDSIRVFGPDGSAHQADIARALDVLVHDRGCHLVNLSLGTASRSELVADALLDAVQAGTLVICAAGNTAGPVEYPAALAEAVAVTALGRLDQAPAGTLAAHRIPNDARLRADPVFIANFSCHGESIDVAGPGVGIISTVPGGGWAAYGGTSMAAPQVTGALAALLADDPDYPGLPADATRSARARAVLVEHSRDLGLDPIYQGHGHLHRSS
ncbi:S8 family serine peptidase [Wenzhouxiangella sp. XN79A]|uniref:S8 family peptidase n=1 Tax=Wenzhouxiangella sp. XN79A TaxID=2724193 RepID=UPI00144AE33D|nr:S8 family serine peptidase [Wenzhouxiangella sp. XN79A]NKI36534.1 S8 family serine peptidase [Wenzhouxiangella sp. XN79A]